MFRIKFPTKRIFRIFPILRHTHTCSFNGNLTDASSYILCTIQELLEWRRFGTCLWNDPRIPIPTCVKNIPERHRQTDGRTDDLLWHNRALHSSAR